MKKNAFPIIGIFAILITSCNNINFMGNNINRPVVETKLNASFILNYSDTLASINKWYNIPERYKWLIDSSNNSHLTYRIYYFEASPNELYFITYDYDIVLREVYNETISEDSWIAIDDKLINNNVRNRIVERYKNEVLSKIETYGKLNHIPDSIMYNFR